MISLGTVAESASFRDHVETHDPNDPNDPNDSDLNAIDGGRVFETSQLTPHHITETSHIFIRQPQISHHIQG